MPTRVMGFNVYWIATVTLELLFAAKGLARVTKPLILNTTEGCLSGNRSLADCGVHAATKNRMKIIRKQMYSTPVGFTYPNVPNSYEVDMGYSPNVGFEPYWPGTTMRGTTRRDYKVCGVICPTMYINYGPVCAINKNGQYRTFLSYCDMRKDDCIGTMRWRAIYKGACNASIRTFPTRSYNIRKRISFYITQYYGRTPTTNAPGVESNKVRRKHGLSNLKQYGVNQDGRNQKAPGSKREQIHKVIVRNKDNRPAPKRGEREGDVRNHHDMGQKYRGQRGKIQNDLGQNGANQKIRDQIAKNQQGRGQKRGKNVAKLKQSGQKSANRKDRGRNDPNHKGRDENGQIQMPVEVSSQQPDIAGNQVHNNNNRIGDPGRKVPGRKGTGRKVQKQKESHRSGEGRLIDNTEAHDVRIQRVFKRKKNKSKREK